MRALATSLPLVAALGSTAAAQARPDSAAKADSARRIEAVRVRAAYAPRVIGSASAVSVAPDSMALGATAPTLGDVMRRLPFVYLRQNSRGESEISVRGSESRQAAVMLEGVPLSLTWDARADVSAVPLTGVAQVDYVRGLSSLLSGPNAIGGVVSARLWADHDAARAPRAVRRGELQADQFGGARASVVAGGALAHSPVQSVQYRMGAGWRDLPGVALPSSVDDPGSDGRLRLNTDARSYDGFAGLRYEHAQGRYLSGFASFSDGARGVAPELHLDAPRFWRNPEVRRLVAGVSAGTGALRSRLGIGDVEFSLGVNDGRVDIESYSDASYATIDATEQGDDRTVTLRVTFDQQLGERVVVRGAFTDAAVRYLETLGTSSESRYRQRLTSVASEVDVLASRFVTFSAGVSQDASVTEEAGGHPPLGRQAGLGWRGGVTWLIPLSGVRVHASASERQRFPALRELYSEALDRFESNPTLRPETARSAEAGVSVSRARVDAQVVAFRQGIEDAVVRITLPSNQFQRVNRDRFTSTGVEVTAGTVLGWVALRGDVTLQRARLADATISGGAERRPEDVPEVFGSLLASAPLSRSVEALARVRFLGATRCTNPDLGALQAQRGAQAVDLGVERRVETSRVPGGLRMALQMENALDRAIYDRCGLPQAGRTLRLTLTLG